MIETVTLNVSDLPPPEPMEQILLALSKLTSNQMLKVTHRKEPFPLFEKLGKSNFAFHSKKLAPNQFVIHIFHIKQKSLCEKQLEETI